jgi:two-component system sensor kinase FixL
MPNIPANLISLNELIAYFPIGVLVFEKQSQAIVQCNEAILELFNYTDQEEFLQKGPFAPEPAIPQPFGTIRELVAKYEKQQHQSTMEIDVMLNNNQVFCTELTINSLGLANNDYVLITFKDITQRKGVQGQLQVSKNTQEAIINTAVDGIIIINNRGVIQLANKAAQQLFRYTEEELIGQNIKILTPEPHYSNHDRYLKNYERTHEPKIIGIGREVDGKRKDGTLFPLRLAVSEVETGNEKLYVGVLHDLTEQKKAEKEILQLNYKLEKKVEERTEKLTDVVNKLLQVNIKLEQEIKEREAAEAALLKNEEELKASLEKEKELNQLKSRFVSMASHEFRTPLTTIASSSELVGLYTNAEQQEKREKHLRRIQSAVTTLTGVLGDFLSLSKLEEGKIHNEAVDFPLQELLYGTLEDMQTLLKPGQIIHPIFEGTDRVITLDKKLLKNIFINLLSNAIKYSGKDSNIWLEVNASDYSVSVKLQDEGIGIPEEDQKHLFTRFFRAENAVNIQGTGLGLNIVKRYIDLLEGNISFESVQGKGTTFYFNVPLIQKEE